MRAHYEYAERTGGAIECHPSCYFTSSTRAKGLCPAGAKCGDLIVVLNGGGVPYLLRRRQTQPLTDPEALVTTFVGECYLLGYMHGEATRIASNKVHVFEIL